MSFNLIKEKIALLLVLFCIQIAVFGQEQSSVIDRYNRVYDTLNNYLNNPKKGSFKDAVFYSEAVYMNDFSYKGEFENRIKLLALFAKGWADFNRPAKYRFLDSLNLNLNFAIYKVLKDTVRIVGSDSQVFSTIPFEYDFSDYFGRSEWSNMFVSKLLVSKKGNCHSLPYLYKIIADELGAVCWLGLAPNHIYIKNRCKGYGWYNTELTSGSFPIDAWITASGYIPLEAIQSGLYMDTLSDQQAIALTVLDLAKGYEFQTKRYDDGFILKCCDLVLKYHPVNAQALLLKAETLKRLYESQKATGNPNIGQTYQDMENLYVKLFNLGYREMPEGMYLKWLKSIETEKSKFQNKTLTESITAPKKAF